MSQGQPADQVHNAKQRDAQARRQDQDGEDLVDALLGEGDVDFEAFVKTLKKIGYTGPLTIEREIPQEPERQKAEIGRAIELLERLKKQIQ